jgi:hypothetical protein
MIARINVILIATLVGAAVLHAQAPAPEKNPFIGTWKLNFEKSTVAAPAPGTVRMRHYQDRGDGLILHTVVTTGPNVDFLFTACRWDGKEYSVFASRTLAQFMDQGTKPPRTVAITLRDTRTIDWTDRVNGRVAVTGVNQVSEDGKTMTESTKQFNSEGKQTSSSVVIYEKQSN